MYSKVYFILAHKKPAQLKELITLLQDGKSFFFIHLDKNVDIHLFESIQQMEGCYFIKKREQSRWGGFGIVQATLNGMMEIQNFMKANHGTENYHCILLSGEDLPLKTNTEIHNLLENKLETSFIHHWKLPYKKWWNGGLFRFESLYIFDYNKHPKVHYWLNKTIRKLKLDFLFPINRIKKKYPDLELFGSSQWMILSKSLMESIVDESIGNQQFKKLFKQVLLPDELYIITFIQNFIKIKCVFIENSPTHLIIFKGVNPNPQYLSVEDIKNNNSEMTLFARKFDNDINGDAVAYIQTII
ncbi:beta-1,6-N-acetylglucosaminyltransferase [Flavobacterium gawalongense]|nr:beta-1,6-N-acetylglucosaminyltransferase [Flavobacterium gawalongense]